MAVPLADGLQIGGLVVNGGLLVGLIVQIRRGSSTRRADLVAAEKTRHEDLRLAAEWRREDLDTVRRMSTIDAWARVVDAITEAELATRVFLGRGVITEARAEEFVGRVKAASGRRERGATAELDDEKVIAANERLRSVANIAQDFAIAIELGAYDLETARRIAGYRLARIVHRHLGYFEHLRRSIGVPELYSELEQFARDFLAEEGKPPLEDTLIIAGPDET